MNKKNIPNIITIIRFILIIPILVSMACEQYKIALFVFAIAGLSDGVDGFLARRYHWISRFGTIADPLADKILMLSTYLMLAYLGKIPLWLMAAVIGRDVIIVGGAVVYRYFIEEPKYGATFVSKLNTTLQLILVVVILFNAGFKEIPDNFIYIFFYVVLTTTVVSLLDYCWIWGRRAWHIKRGTAND